VRSPGVQVTDLIPASLLLGIDQTKEPVVTRHWISIGARGAGDFVGAGHQVGGDRQRKCRIRPCQNHIRAVTSDLKRNPGGDAGKRVAKDSHQIETDSATGAKRTASCRGYIVLIGRANCCAFKFRHDAEGKIRIVVDARNAGKISGEKGEVV